MPSLYHGSEAIVAAYIGSVALLQIYNGAELVADFSEPSGLERIELLGPIENSGVPTTSSSLAITDVGANRKLIGTMEFEGGGSRTLDAFSFNGVAFNEILVHDASTNGAGMGYLDDDELPSAGNYTLLSTLSGNGAQIVAALHYRGMAQGAPLDSDEQVGSSTPSLSLTTTVGGVVVTLLGNTGAQTFTWANSEDELVSEDGPAAGQRMYVAVIEDVAGTSQTTGGTWSDSNGVERIIAASFSEA